MNLKISESKHKFLKKYHTLCTTIWENRPLLVIFTLGCSFLDVVFLYDTFVVSIRQSEWMSVAGAVLLAALLNVCASLAGIVCYQLIHCNGKFQSMILLLLIVGFLILLCSTTAPKMEYGHLLKAESASATSGVTDAFSPDISTDVSEDTADDDNSGWSTVVLLTLEPIATDILCFCIAYSGAFPAQLKRRLLALMERREEIKNEQVFYGNQLERIKKLNLEELKKEDEARYQAALHALARKIISCQAASRLCLARYLGDASATSFLISEANDLMKNISNSKNTVSFPDV